MWEGDEPRALEKERKRTSMQDNNILGVKNEERDQGSFILGGLGQRCVMTAQDLPEGLATDRRRRPSQLVNRLRNVR